MLPANYFAERTTVDPETGCHNWRLRTVWGYGTMKLDGKHFRAHRVAYEVAKGPIPPGLVIDHLCGNKACCNPEHLEAVTQRENTLRGSGPSARQARQTHCVHGHPFDEDNTAIRPNGARRCKACQALHARNYNDRMRGQWSAERPVTDPGTTTEKAPQ